MKRIGIIGDGQLGAMLVEAGYSLNLNVSILDLKNNQGPATFLTKTFNKIEDFLSTVDIITFESENIDTDYFAKVTNKPILPSLEAIKIFQDRFFEKTLFDDLDIPTTNFKCVSSFNELESALEIIGTPAVLKTRKQGYDGKGQVVIKNKKDLDPCREVLKNNQSLILEEFIRFDREISVIAASNGKDVSIYPISENLHKNGILITSVGSLKDGSQNSAESLIRKIIQHINYQGVIALELFEKEGKLIANECAPRVHNSGHWTLLSDCSSQFENHLRGICGVKLGNTSAEFYCGIINIIEKIPPMDLKLSGRIHLYGKTEAPKRKLGHVNYLATSSAELRNMMELDLEILQNNRCLYSHFRM